MDKTYRVVTREYLAEGYDGFDALKRGEFVVDHENGQLMSAIVRKFLLGASYLWRMKQIRRLQAENASSSMESRFLPTLQMPRALSRQRWKMPARNIRTATSTRSASAPASPSLELAHSNLLKRAMKYNLAPTAQRRRHLSSNKPATAPALTAPTTPSCGVWSSTSHRRLP